LTLSVSRLPLARRACSRTSSHSCLADCLLLLPRLHSYHISTLPRGPTLFPYPTLFRSAGACPLDVLRECLALELDLSHPLRGIQDRKRTRLNSSHQISSYAVFCLQKQTEP